MAIPEGYSFLAKIGVAYKEDYDENVTYNQYDAVYYNGSTYIALVDSPVGPPTADGVNWQYMAQGFLSQVISSLTAIDKNGVIGEAGATVNAQNLIDGMSDAIGDKLDKDGDASSTTAIFEQASERTNIASGDKQSTLFGKIKKWFADMTIAAFTQVITSKSDLLANTLTGYFADALIIKQLYEELNSNLNTANLKLNLGGNVTSVRFATLKASGLGNIRFIYADGSCHLLNITTSGLEYKYVDANGNENTLWSK